MRHSPHPCHSADVATFTMWEAIQEQRDAVLTLIAGSGYPSRWAP